MASRFILLATLVGCSGGTLASAQQDERPNIVVVLVDDLRFDGTGATGHDFVETPAINRLAREGMTFRNAFVTTPLCSPARASFLTGRYARAHSVVTNGIPDPQTGFDTFAMFLENAGYRTAFIGKWHMGTDDSPRPGFTHWVGFPGQGNYWNQELNINGRKVPTSGHLNDVLSRRAVQFVLDALEQPEPFLVYLSHKAVHGPFTPPERHDGIYDEESVSCTPACRDPLDGKPVLTRPVPGEDPIIPGLTGPGAPGIRRQMSLMPSVDDGVGALIQTLLAAGELDRTVFVFTSDNGYFHGEHGLDDKRWAYEAGIRIPFIVRYPPLIQADRTNDALVLNVDMAPTLLELAGIKPPEKIEGRSLVPFFTGPVAWRTSFALEYFDERVFPRIPTWEAIRTTQFKYIRYPQLGPDFDELYDYAFDPHELANQIANPQYTQQVEGLESLLDGLLAEIPDNSRR